MREYLRQTQRERQGGIDGLNLFFGALLGANLGTLERLPLGDYVQLIVLLAGTVMTLRMISTSERRLYALLTLALYIVVVSIYLLAPGFRPEGLSEIDTARLAATLAVWVAAVLLLEYWPVRNPDLTPSGSQAQESAAPPPQ